MIDLYIGGACPLRAMTYALSRALICPLAPLTAPLPQGGLGVVTACGRLEDAIAFTSRTAARTDRPWLLAHFEHAFTSTCSGIMLMLPVPTGVEIMMVHPFLQKKGAPMILISACAKRAFAFDAQGEISEVSPPKRSKASAGADRGWAELKRRMQASAAGHPFWPHESYEIRVA